MSLRYRIGIALSMGSVFAQAATAASNTIATAQTTSPINSVAANPVVASNPFGLLAGLVFLLVLVLVAAWLVKRGGGLQAGRTGATMKVVAALAVGPRERVVLIELAGQQWLLGVTPNAINQLHHFEQPIVTTAVSADDFSSKLRQFLPQGFGK